MKSYLEETIDDFCRKIYEKNKFKPDEKELEERKKSDDLENKLSSLTKKISLVMKKMKKNPHIKLSYKKMPSECDNPDKTMEYHDQMFTYYLQKLTEEEEK